MSHLSIKVSRNKLPLRSMRTWMQTSCRKIMHQRCSPILWDVKVQMLISGLPVLLPTSFFWKRELPIVSFEPFWLTFFKRQCFFGQNIIMATSHFASFTEICVAWIKERFEYQKKKTFQWFSTTFSRHNAISRARSIIGKRFIWAIYYWYCTRVDYLETTCCHLCC